MFKKLLSSSGHPSRIFLSSTFFSRRALLHQQQQHRFYTSPSVAASSASPNNKLSIDVLASRLKSGDRSALSKCITLVESKLRNDHALAQELLLKLSTTSSTSQQEQQKKQIYRIGISGPPGAGKSTFIEAFGRFLTAQGKKVAVIAVDPSSTRTGGSILGDKTRMTELSRDENAYIRPCPSGGYLGGVTANAFEVVLLCEHAQYDYILIETVGVGQSETQVVDLTDMVLLLVPPTAGDELQGIKRGIVEIADLIVVNKADGELMDAAKKTRNDYENAVMYMTPSNPHWFPKVVLASAATFQVQEVSTTIDTFWKVMQEAKQIEAKRARQRRNWMWKQVSEELLTRLMHDESNHAHIAKIEEAVETGKVSPRLAADSILELYISRKHNKKE